MGIGWVGNRRIKAEPYDAAVGADQDRGIGNGGGVDRYDPGGSEPERPHHPPRNGLYMSDWRANWITIPTEEDTVAFFAKVVRRQVVHQAMGISLRRDLVAAFHDAAHEAAESPQHAADEASGKFQGGDGKSNTDPAHEAGESAARASEEAAHDATVTTRTDPPADET
jgi:hypothetical protein